MKRERGSALLVVFILLTILGAIALSNSIVLRNLKREIKLVERQQLKKYTLDQTPGREPKKARPQPRTQPVGQTNAPPETHP